jgi:peroxiredoxin
MLRTGQEAPPFTLVGAAGDNVAEHSLDEYLDAGWTVVLVFYPFDFHPACIDRLCTLRDADWLTVLEDVAVLGVGTDGAYSHRRFGAAYDLQFPLLSDADGHVAAAYGARHDELEGHRGVARSALFVVDPGGTVRYAWAAADPGDAPDFDAVERAARSADGAPDVADRA